MTWDRKRDAPEKELLPLLARQTLGQEAAERLASRIREGLDWPSFAQQAFHEGIAPLLYHHCRAIDVLDSLPEGTRKYLARIYAETTLINRHLLKAATDLDQMLQKEGMQAILLKGAALLRTVYRDIALRPMEDIDLLVRPADLPKLERILQQMGFLRKRLYPGSFVQGILSIDVHTDILSSHRIRSRQALLEMHPDDVWRTATPVDGTSALYSLSFNVQGIALSFHLLKHRFARLLWFVDIAELIEAFSPSLDWEGLIADAQRVRAEKLLLYTLLLTKGLLGTPIPEAVCNRLGKETLSPWERSILRLRLAHRPLGTTADLLWMFLIRGAGPKVRFIKENLFPRGEVMQQIYPHAPDCFATFLHRSVQVLWQLVSDLFKSCRGVLAGGLPPL